MYKQQYEDYKYVMQDTYQIYLGVKYTLEEIVENEDVPFKFRLIVERYLYEEVDPKTTLESHLYHLTSSGLPVKIYKQLKAKVKYLVQEEKKGLFGKAQKQYVTKILPVDQFVKITTAEKEQQGLVIQELTVGKLATMAF